MPVTSTTTTTRLEFPRGAQRLTVRVEAGMPALYRARFGGPRPTVHEADGTLTIDYPRLAPSGFPGLARRSADITLDPRVAWDLALGGVSRMSGDLRGLDLRSLEIAGGVSGLDLELPAPRGVVPLRIRGGARAVTLRLGAGTAARLRIAGGASRIAFDDQHFGAVGGGLRLQTDDADAAEDRFEIDVEGGASGLTVVRGVD